MLLQCPRERAQDLAEFVTELVRKGIDFTTVWTTVLVMRPPHRVGLVTLREMRSSGVRGLPISLRCSLRDVTRIT